MANVDRPNGLRPVGHLDGSKWNGRTTMWLIPSSDATAVYVGDIVKHAGGSGAAGTIVNGQDVEGMPTCIRATAGTTGQDIVGVVVGFLPNQSDLSVLYRVASTNRIALVASPSDTVFEIQEDALTTPVAAASVGLNAAYTTTAGSTTTGQSGVELDSDSVNTTSTLPLRIIGLSKRVDNNFNTGGADTDQAKFLVVFNTHYFAKNIAGV